MNHVFPNIANILIFLRYCWLHLHIKYRRAQRARKFFTPHSFSLQHLFETSFVMARALTCISATKKLFSPFNIRTTLEYILETIKYQKQPLCDFKSVGERSEPPRNFKTEYTAVSEGFLSVSSINYRKNIAFLHDNVNFEPEKITT